MKRRRTSRERLYTIQNGVCWWCREQVSAEQATIEHIVPVSRGGAHRFSNFVMACGPSVGLDGRPRTEGDGRQETMSLVVDFLMRRPDGATVEEISAATRLMPLTVHDALTSHPQWFIGVKHTMKWRLVTTAAEFRRAMGVAPREDMAVQSHSHATRAPATAWAFHCGCCGERLEIVQRDGLRLVCHGGCWGRGRA